MAYYSVVFYEKSSGSTFDMDYYVNKHMPLVLKQWGPHGLQGYLVKQPQFMRDGSEPSHYVHVDLIWESKEKQKIALQSAEAEAVFADVPKFSSVKPFFAGAELLAKA